MAQLEPRQPTINAVPLIFECLDLEAATVTSIAESYGVPREFLEKAFDEAVDQGYLETDGESLYRVTDVGRSSIVRRGSIASDVEPIIESALTP